MQALYTAAHTRVKSKAPKDPWWTKPHLVFCVPAALFWLVILYSYTQVSYYTPPDNICYSSCRQQLQRSLCLIRVCAQLW
jgi:hypothetical protein